MTLVMTHSFHLYGPGIVSETKDKRPNAKRKDIPIALIVWEIQGLQVLWARNGDKGEIYISYDKSKYHRTSLFFLYFNE